MRIGRSVATAIAAHAAIADAHHSPGKFEEIGDTLLSAPAASIEFSGIAAGYALLLLYWHDIYGDSTDSQDLQLTFNSDTGNNYDYGRNTYGGALVTNHASAHLIVGDFGDTDGEEKHATGFLQVFNRAAQEKTYVGNNLRVIKGGAAAEDVEGFHLGGKWRNTTDEIHTITLTPSAGNFVAGSRVILLGVKT